MRPCFNAEMERDAQYSNIRQKAIQGQKTPKIQTGYD